MFAQGYPDTGSVLCYVTWNMGHCYAKWIACVLIASCVELKRLAMAPKAMEVAKRHSAVKTVREAKAKATQRQRAKVHTVKKKPSQAQASPSQETDVQEEQEDEQQEEHHGGMSGG